MKSYDFHKINLCIQAELEKRVNNLIYYRNLMILNTWHRHLGTFLIITQVPPLKQKSGLQTLGPID